AQLSRAAAVLGEDFAGKFEDGFEPHGELSPRGRLGDAELVDEFPTRGKVAVKVVGEVGACHISRLHGPSPQAAGSLAVSLQVELFAERGDGGDLVIGIT